MDSDQFQNKIEYNAGSQIFMAVWYICQFNYNTVNKVHAGHKPVCVATGAFAINHPYTCT